MPHLRNMWPDHDGDDRWWIHPLDDRVRGDETIAVGPPRSAGAGRGRRAMSERPTTPTAVDCDHASPRAAASTADVLVGGPDDGHAGRRSFHGFAGHLGGEPMLAALADAGFRVLRAGVARLQRAPAARSRSRTCSTSRCTAPTSSRRSAWRRIAPHLIGHSMGGMIAAEMAALAPHGVRHAGRSIDPLGLWLDEHPIPDIYTLLPFEFPPLLFHDAAAGTALMAGGGVDFGDPQAIQRFLIGNSRRLGTAGKILFPIPNRRLSKRLYRDHQPDAAAVGRRRPAACRAPYAEAWAAALPARRHGRRSPTPGTWRPTSSPPPSPRRSPRSCAGDGPPAIRNNAAYVAACLATMSAAVSAYWAVGGTALLDTVGGGFERMARRRDAAALGDHLRRGRGQARRRRRWR